MSAWTRDTVLALYWYYGTNVLGGFDWTVQVTDKHSTVAMRDTFKVVFKPTVAGINRWDLQIPKEYVVYQNYPNPFNPATTIRFGLPERAKVMLEIFNTIGQVVETIHYGEVLDPAYYEAVWNASGRASGMYIAVLQAESVAQPSRFFRSVKKLLLVK
jgi:hypothetical protein